MRLKSKPRWGSLKYYLIAAAEKAAKTTADAGWNPETGAIICIRTATGWNLEKTCYFIKAYVKLPERSNEPSISCSL